MKKYLDPKILLYIMKSNLASIRVQLCHYDQTEQIKPKK